MAATEFEIVHLPEQPTAVVHGVVATGAIREFFDRAFREVFTAVGRAGRRPAGEPFGFYLSMPTDTLELEVGVPVDVPIEADGDVVPSSLPAGPAVRAVHVGPYEDLPATYEALAAWAAQEGVVLGPAMWECYLDDPSSVGDASGLHTQVVWPLAEGSPVPAE